MVWRPGGGTRPGFIIHKICSNIKCASPNSKSLYYIQKSRLYEGVRDLSPRLAGGGIFRVASDVPQIEMINNLTSIVSFTYAEVIRDHLRAFSGDCNFSPEPLTRSRVIYSAQLVSADLSPRRVGGGNPFLFSYLFLGN